MQTLHKMNFLLNLNVSSFYLIYMKMQKIYKVEARNWNYFDDAVNIDFGESWLKWILHDSKGAVQYTF